MKLNTQNPFLKALIVAVIAMVLGVIGLDISKSDIEEAVEQGLPDIDIGMTQPSSQINGLYQVMHVIDGDTAVVQTQSGEQKIRIVGIDTPETKSAPGGADCFASEATIEAERLLKDKQVLIATDPTQDSIDEYGRWLVTVTLPTGEDFGELMIAGGFAKEFTYRTPHQKQTVYREAESAAQAAASGLWDCRD